MLLVDDQQLVRTGFRMILEDEPDIEVVGEAPTAAPAVDRPPSDPARCRRHGHPDAGHGRHRGHAAARPRRRRPRTRGSSILTTFDADENVVEALRAGASGFLLKDVTPADFVVAIRIIAAGDALLAPAVTRRLLDRYADRLPPVTESATPRCAS